VTQVRAGANESQNVWWRKGELTHLLQVVGNPGAFEPTPFDADDLKAQRKNLRRHRLPHLVATIDGAVVGHAYAVLFRKRPAYRFTVKHSIYVTPTVSTPASDAFC
jgi:L-amino acid N-acyltransferase YncA